jgi:DNA-3-methyladenine glycosylase
MKKLSASFYRRQDVFEVAQDLIGKVLCSKLSNEPLCSGKIVEVEAYFAPEDKASHAFDNKRTPRTETMFAAGGVGYVYVCYGVHHLFNVVTNEEDIPHAVLIRALEPIEGVETMLKRRKKDTLDTKLTSGPGALAQALGITKKMNGISLQSSQLWIEDRNLKVKDIVATERVGIDYAQEFANKPWRFYLLDSPWVSALKKKDKK